MYEKLKESLKAENRLSDYQDIVLTSAVSMFEYTGVTIEFAQYIELFLRLQGQCAVWKQNDKLIASSCTRIGNINEYGLGKDLQCITLNGKSKTFKNFEDSNDVVYIRNNSLAIPDNCISWYSTCLAEIDKSIMHNIINSRYSPLVRATTTKEKGMIEQALENNNGSGKPQVVVTSMDNLFEKSETSTSVLNITDVTNSDKIQYLSHAHDDIVRRLYNLYGMDIRGTGKMAQQTTDEINNGDNSQMIMPNDNLKHRKKGIEEVNEKFGTNISVKFSKCWEREEEERELTIESMENEVENTQQEETQQKEEVVLTQQEEQEVTNNESV